MRVILAFLGMGLVALGSIASFSAGCGGDGTTNSTSSSSGAGGHGGGQGGQGGGNGGNGGGTGGSVPGQACLDCVADKMIYAQGTACATTIANCQNDVDCAEWLTCTQNCIQMNYVMECFAACDQAKSVVSNLYLPVYDCTCNACSGECSPACP